MALSNNIQLDGNRYIRFPIKDSLYPTDGVFVDFTLNLLDWNQVGTSQIVGNFNGQGYGVFYENGFENVLDFSVMDSGNNHLFYFNEDGGLVSQRSIPSQTEPLNITAYVVDHLDTKYYYDRANGVCFKFDSNNILITQFNILPDIDVSVMVVDNVGCVYFLNKTNNNILKYNNLGVYSMTLPLEHPTHNNIVVLANGAIRSFLSKESTPMIADTNDNFYNLFGMNIYRNGQPWFYVNQQANTIGIDADDNIWVIYANNRVLKINTSGKKIFDRLFHQIKPCQVDTCPQKSVTVDKVGLGFTRIGDTTNAWVVLNQSNYIIQLNEDGEVLNCSLTSNLLDVNSYPNVSYNNTNLLVNGDFTGFYSRKRFNLNNSSLRDSKVKVKVALINPCNSFVTIKTLTADVTGLTSGSHNISFEFSATSGKGVLSIDGNIRDTFTSEGVIYYIKDNRPPFLIGANSGNFRSRQEELGVITPKYFRGTIESLNIATLAQESVNSRRIATELNFEFQTVNPISYTESVDKFFMFRPSGINSTQYNINVKNAGVSDVGVRSKIEQDIKETIKQKTPASTTVKDIVWKQEVRFKDLI